MKCRFDSIGGPAVRVLGTGSHVPAEIITNDDLARLVDTSDEWIVSRTGMKERRRAAAHEATSDLGLPAAERALEAAGLKGSDLDLILVGTATPDNLFPSTACRLQRRLGAEQAAAMDVAAACSGFIYALGTGAAHVRAGTARHVLVVGAETLTKITDYSDRNSCILFGDGAGAVVLGPDAPGTSGLRYVHLGAAGEEDLHGEESIILPGGGSREPTSVQTVTGGRHFMKIKGREVFQFAVRKFRELTQEIIDENGMASGDIDWLIPHQMNLRIIESAIKAVDIPVERVILTIHKYANTSAASIPITLDEAVRDGRIRRGQQVVMLAFGAGLTWGSALLRY